MKHIIKKRSNRNVEGEKLIITPLPIRKAQNKFPIIPINLNNKSEKNNEDKE